MKMTDLLESLPKGGWLIIVGVAALLWAWQARGPARVTVLLLIGILSVALGIALLAFH